MTVLHGRLLVLMLAMLMASFKLSNGCIFPPPPPRCVGKPSENQLTTNKEPCIFPFKYESKEYSQCFEFEGFKLCATEIYRNCTAKRFGICTGSGSGVCDISNKNKTKIVGGDPVYDHTQFPFQVGLIIRNDDPPVPFCGGSIIGIRWILSAAHCTEGPFQPPRPPLLVEEIQVLMGVTFWDLNPITRYNVIYKSPHYLYTYNRAYDTLLLEMEQDIIFSDYVKRIRLQPPNLQLPLERCYLVSGWGFLSVQDFNAEQNQLQPLQPEVLQVVTVRIITDVGCGRLGGSNVIPPQLCIVGSQVFTDSACVRDSGGPLFDPVSRRLVGVVRASFPGRVCREPTLYVRVNDEYVLRHIELVSGIVPE